MLLSAKSSAGQGQGQGRVGMLGRKFYFVAGNVSTCSQRWKVALARLSGPLIRGALSVFLSAVDLPKKLAWSVCLIIYLLICVPFCLSICLFLCFSCLLYTYTCCNLNLLFPLLQQIPWRTLAANAALRRVIVINILPLHQWHTAILLYIIL
jgi:hypothetical protein